MLVNLISVGFSLTSILFLKPYIHAFQLKSYFTIRYLKFVLKTILLLTLTSLFTFIFELSFNNIFLTFFCRITDILVIILCSKSLIKSKKTPLVITNRIKITYTISIVLILLCSIYRYNVYLITIAFPFIPAISCGLDIITKIKNKKFISSAVKKIKNSKAKIIAITGSNGKTSTKNILNSFLNEKFSCIASPKSYNTPLGIAKFINEELTDGVDFIILEYGARKKGDIRKLCTLFSADYGIITTVAPQHIESFKSVENVYKTKKELCNYLGKKLCIYNLDNLYTLRMFIEKNGEKKSVSIYSKTANIFASNIAIINGKTEFTLGNKKVFTQLLGRHNVLDILLAFALAKQLGISDEILIQSIEKLRPVPHRLEHIKSRINILDDSYNCSLSSAKESIWTLNQFMTKKIVATPGIIEGGKYQYELNFELGKILINVDEVIIIGDTNKKAIQEGIESALNNFSLNSKSANKNIKANHTPEVNICKNLEYAKTLFYSIPSNSTLLLLNDLPDDYH